ncbi:MAG: alpha/beta fold hydrolase [Pseudomonadota bacterium]
MPKGTPTELSQWLAAQEHKAQVTDGTEAHIVFADASKPAPTRWVFLYLHGFSATWPETAPLTQTLANHYQANVFQSRLSGHGLGTEGMHASAEDWLESVATQFHIASRLGDQIIIVATSTGAALSVWLAQHYPERIDAILHLSPNYRVRNPLGQILTWPWSPLWVPWIVGSYREWEPISEEQRRFWSTRQPVSALIEMQKVVDWVQQQDLSKIQVPLATMYMINDPTIAPNAAVKAHRQWGADYKQLIKVVPDGNEASHVFVGDICGPSRNEWCTEQFRLFLDPLRASPT